MKPNPKSIQKSIQISIRQQSSGKALLAKSFTKCMNDAFWVTNELKIEFCVLFLNAILDRSSNQKSNDFTDRLKRKSIHFGIRLLKRYPQRGLEILVNLIMDELIDHQKYSQDELFQFYSEVFDRFFPATPSPAF
jgi:hypothetical protein